MYYLEPCDRRTSTREYNGNTSHVCCNRHPDSSVLFFKVIVNIYIYIYIYIYIMDDINQWMVKSINYVIGSSKACSRLLLKYMRILMPH